MVIRAILTTIMAALIAACGNIAMGTTAGVPLSEFERGDTAPVHVVVAGSNFVNVVDGPAYDIAIDGPAESAEQILFERDGDALIISREDGIWNGTNEVATVTVTLPALSVLTIGGSGRLSAERLTGDGEITVGGSGEITVERIDTSSLAVSIGGSGSVTGAGTTETLDLSIGGSGEARLQDVSVGTADVTIGGSGSARFASDGRVEGTIAGSGTVRVDGTAECTSSSAGSGELICG